MGHRNYPASRRAPREATTLEDRRELLLPVFDLMAQGVLTGKALECHGLDRVILSTWLRQDDTLNRNYLNARTQQAAALAEKALSVAAEPVTTLHDAAQKRTYVDTLRWAASKLDPSRWADKLLVEETSTKVVKHVVMLPPRQGPPPAIVGGREIASIGPGNAVTGLVDRSLQRKNEGAVTECVPEPLYHPQSQESSD